MSAPTSADLAALLVERLNEIHSHDPDALTELVAARVPCGPALAAHPSVQIDGDARGGLLGVIGLINGLVGALPTGKQRVCTLLDYGPDDRIICIGFELVER